MGKSSWFWYYQTLTRKQVVVFQQIKNKRKKKLTLKFSFVKKNTYNFLNCLSFFVFERTKRKTNEKNNDFPSSLQKRRKQDKPQSWSFFSTKKLLFVFSQANWNKKSKVPTERRKKETMLTRIIFVLLTKFTTKETQLTKEKEPEYLPKCEKKKIRNLTYSISFFNFSTCVSDSALACCCLKMFVFNVIPDAPLSIGVPTLLCPMADMLKTFQFLLPKSN